MPKRLLTALDLAALLALTGCQRGEQVEVTIQHYQYLVDLCNEVRSIDHDLAAVRAPAERGHLEWSRKIRVRHYNEGWAAGDTPGFEDAGLPNRLDGRTPARCGGLSWSG